MWLITRSCIITSYNIISGRNDTLYQYLQRMKADSVYKVNRSSCVYDGCVVYHQEYSYYLIEL